MEEQPFLIRDTTMLATIMHVLQISSHLFFLSSWHPNSADWIFFPLLAFFCSLLFLRAHSISDVYSWPPAVSCMDCNNNSSTSNGSSVGGGFVILTHKRWFVALIIQTRSLKNKFREHFTHTLRSIFKLFYLPCVKQHVDAYDPLPTFLFFFLITEHLFAPFSPCPEYPVNVNIFFDKFRRLAFRRAPDLTSTKF